MRQGEYLSIPQLAKILGLTRIAVYKKVKNGQIKAIRIGRIYAIPKSGIISILGKVLGDKEKKEIDRAVKRIVKEYGEVLKLLGRE
jgi:excisionase family DNA binding protein